MGVTGLIKFVDAATTRTTVSSIRGTTVAIDSYYLLHKGSYGCADRLVQGIKTDALISYAMKYVKMLQNLKINVIMVFDGQSLKAKEKTNKKRRFDRDVAKSKAADLLRDGKVEEARKEFTKAVNITHEHALELMRACRKMYIDCIVAMYEADAQLAYLNKIGAADYVISEDSDLILFGCNKIVYKLALDGTCVIFDSTKLPAVMNRTPENFSFDIFRRICILSGCDYVDSLRGVGLAKARKFFEKAHEQDLNISLYKVPSFLNLKNVTVTQEYVDDFLKAEATFKYMYVFDPIASKMVRLNDLNDDDNLIYCENAGELLDNATAYQLALGNLNPKTLLQVYNFNPFKTLDKNRPSIWRSDSAKKEPHTKVRVQTQIGIFFRKKVNPPPPELQDIINEENNVAEEIEMDSLITSYCGGGNESMSTTSELNSSKRPYTILEDMDDTQETLPTPSQHNPFAKKRKSVNETREAENVSLLKNLKEDEETNDENRVVMSRFFNQDEELQKRLEKNRQFYNITKNMRDRSKQENSADDEELKLLNCKSIKIDDDDDNVFYYNKQTNIFISKPKENTHPMPVEAIDNLNEASDNLINAPDNLIDAQIDLVDAPDNQVEASDNQILNQSDNSEMTILENDEKDDQDQRKASSYAILADLKKQNSSIKSNSQPVPSLTRKPSRLNLKRKAPPTSLSQATQSKLSKFGFIKKESL